MRSEPTTVGNDALPSDRRHPGPVARPAAGAPAVPDWTGVIPARWRGQPPVLPRCRTGPASSRPGSEASRRCSRGAGVDRRLARERHPG
ncbi:MAG: hypothetical protein ACRCZD_14630 [Phycicoccus sp.]